MDRRGLSVTIVALMLAVMMTSSTTASPGMNAMQSPGSEDGQPTAEHNTLYMFGNAGLTNCNSKFNNTNADSAEYGEDLKWGWFGKKIDENTLLMPFGNKLSEPLIPEPIGVMTSMRNVDTECTAGVVQWSGGKDNGIQ